jgi:glycine oxidase
MTTAGAHVVVVGGGIGGAFAAYSLARLGASVTLVERGELGGGASGRNPGGLNPMHGPGIPGPLHALALESFRLHLDCWDDVRERSGIDFSGRVAPRIQLALDDADLAGLERARELYDATPGFSATPLSPEELRAEEPRLSAELRGGLLTEGNGKVDSGAYTRAVATASGATVVHDEARGLERRGSRVTGVVLDSGTLGCDGVVIATGAWTAGPATWLETALPVEPVKGELLLATPAGGGIGTDLAWQDTAVYATGGARVWLGGTEADADFDEEPTAEATTSILERVERLLPGLAPVEIERQTAALRPATPDGFPLAGLAPGVDNVFLALGGGRKGVLFASAMGQAAADILLTGRSDLSIEACSPTRFAAEPAGAAR